MTDKLSPREAEVHGLLLDGLSRKEIAGRLGVGGKTVHAHVHAVLKKRGMHSVHALLAAEIRRLRDALDARAA